MKKTVNTQGLRIRMMAAASIPICGFATAAACSAPKGAVGLVVAPMSSSSSSLVSFVDAGVDAASSFRALPPEPHAPSGKGVCQRVRTCVSPESEPVPWPYAPPYDHCLPSLSRGGGTEASFSVIETQNKRTEEPDTCCYVEFECNPRPNNHIVRPMVGRPVLDHDGSVRVASFQTRKSSPRHSAWHRSALLEHASVASFARLSLSLLSVGAPLDLVRDAHRAALEEIEHARLAFGHAQTTPTDLALDTTDLPIPNTLRDVVSETLAAGCINETIAAAMAYEGALMAENSAERETLLRIAAEEESHAALAYRTLAWAKNRDEMLVRDLIRTTLFDLSKNENAEWDDPILNFEECRRVARDVVNHVIVPCLTALLVTPVSDPTPS